MEEQKVIYELLRDYNPEGGINQLYITWGVDSTGKRRKHHFIEKLFVHPSNLQESKNSAEQVCKIAGIYGKCEEYATQSKKLSHKDFDLFVSDTQQKMAATAKSRRRMCVLL